ncbi:MAG: hypothetical protein K8I02_06225 [Candidatus Methylomirabilis sp.]|nr:hypothetical protein [Deltaproteobacteria bacterium]
MARRGRDQVTVRLDDEILQKLRQQVGEERGRAGGLALYLRRLVYQDLGLSMPEQYGQPGSEAAAPSLAARVEHWLHPAPPAQDLDEAARILARATGGELLPPEEVQRLREAEREAERLRARPPAPKPPAGPSYEEGRQRGLLEAAELAERLAGASRGSGGSPDKVAGLEEAAAAARTRAGESERLQALKAMAESSRGTRYADPGWLRSSAREWQLRLQRNPDDADARRELERIRNLAEAFGVELPPPPEPKRGRAGRKGSARTRS